MIRELIEERLELTRLKVGWARRRLSHLARDQFRRGFDEGYRQGRQDERAGVKDRVHDRKMSDHPQVTIDGIEVDEGMADLLVALWKLGIETQFSCQGDIDCYVPHQPFSGDHAAHIIFADIEIAYRFLIRTIELRGHTGFTEGNIWLTAMDRLSSDTPVRAQVAFSPADLAEITSLWREYETVVPPAPSQDQTKS